MLQIWLGDIFLPIIRKYDSVTKCGCNLLECLSFCFTRSCQGRPQQKSTNIVSRTGSKNMPPQKRRTNMPRTHSNNSHVCWRTHWGQPRLLYIIRMMLSNLRLSFPYAEWSPATLTIKCDAAAKPITLLRRAMGKTSAPYNQVVLLSMPSAY